VEQTDTLLMAWLQSLGLTDHKEHLHNFMITKLSGFQLGPTVVHSKLTASESGIWEENNNNNQIVIHHKTSNKNEPNK